MQLKHIDSRVVGDGITVNYIFASCHLPGKPSSNEAHAVNLHRLGQLAAVAAAAAYLRSHALL